jgi:hypothetical protein
MCRLCLTPFCLIKATFPKTSHLHLSLVIKLKVSTMILTLINSLETFKVCGNMADMYDDFGYPYQPFARSSRNGCWLRQLVHQNTG